MPPRAALDAGAAGVAESQQAGDLIEGLARGIIDRAAQEVSLDRAPAVIQARVASRDNQADGGIDFPIRVGKLAGVEMAFEVIHGHQRHIE